MSFVYIYIYKSVGVGELIALNLDTTVESIRDRDSNNGVYMRCRYYQCVFVLYVCVCVSRAEASAA